MCYLDEITTFRQHLLSFRALLASSSKTGHVGAMPDAFHFVEQVYEAILTRNYVAFQRLLLVPQDRGLGEMEELERTLARLCVPEMRQHAWNVIERGYKVFTDLDWLSQVLLYPEAEGHGPVKDFLKSKGHPV